MAIIDQFKFVCDRLAPLGWRDLLLAATNNALDILQPTNAKLLTAMTATLPSIDRTRRGFEDFHPSGVQAITGGQPARSLLYHAMASPQVHPTATGNPSPTRVNYPTLVELDVIENFIYSLVSDRTDLNGTVVAVFAYQYREASRTSHLRHADVAYSRTGVARVGTTGHNYDPSRRSFWVIPEAGGDAISVLPARYGVFLARKAKPGAAGSVQGGHSGPAGDDYVFPLHKLFAGTECLKGRNLAVQFLEFHRNEKLRKIHRLPEPDGGLPVPAGFDIAKAPYIRDSMNGGKLASLKAAGSTVLVVPEPGATLVRTVSQKNSVTNTNQLVHFIVPKARTVRGNDTRITDSSLTIPSFGADRVAPEYVNIRHQIVPAGPVTQKPKDLNTLNAAAFTTAMRDGGHAAAHFADDSCDGCVEAVVSGLAVTPVNLPAFSLITAPDFFPLADQIELESDPSIIRVKPLSKGRLPANPSLPRPSDLASFAFDRSDKTVTAVVGGFASGPQTSIIGHSNRAASFLPDAASDVFAPGWDVSRSRDSMGTFLTSSGLGSPFPEDAKLCAALSSFWPAVAPDNGRTFGNQPDRDVDLGNQLPMLDEELGFHPNHERVGSGSLTSYRGWDGEFGPFFEKVGANTYVNFVTIERSDYVSNALAGRVRVSLTAEVQSEDLIARHQALNACERILVLGSNTGVCLVVVRKVTNWATSNPGTPQLAGGGFLFEFAELSGSPASTPELSRVRQKVKKKHICQVGSNGVAYKNGSAAFKFVPN
jgi:hypothetical protein